MQFSYHALIGAAVNITIPDPEPVVSFSPVVLPTPGQQIDLQMRVTAPASYITNSSSPGPAAGAGPAQLPVILFAHGAGDSHWLSSLDGYTPITEFWASHGFVVVQPTLPDSAFLGQRAPAGDEYFWQARARAMVRVLDGLDAVEAAVPGLSGRLDRGRVAVAGHSLGSWTASLLLGAANTDPRPNATTGTVRMQDRRIKAGVILSGTGNGGADLSDNGRQMVPCK